MRSLTVGPQFQQPFETGAMLMTMLAFPGVEEADFRVNAYEALCAQTINVSCLADPSQADGYRSEFPAYANIDPREIKRRLRTFGRCLRDRMIAAKMSLGYFEEMRTGEAALLPEGLARPSLNELSALVLSELHQSVSDNVEKRVWRASLPVIHLAVAYQLLLRHRADIGQPYGGDLQDLEAHRLVVAIAQMHEPLAIADHRFNVTAETLVRLHWLE